MIESNYIYLAVGLIAGLVLSFAFLFVKNKFFVKKIVATEQIRQELLRASKNLREVNDVIKELYLFFGDLQKKTVIPERGEK